MWLVILFVNLVAFFAFIAWQVFFVFPDPITGKTPRDEREERRAEGLRVAGLKSSPYRPRRRGLFGS